jgi:hypothetical protein
MERERRYLKKVCPVKIEPYLAEYINSKYSRDPHTGGLRIPCSADLYHCVWENMSRRRSNQPEILEESGNVLISLPCRSREDGQAWKDPAYFNYLSPRGAHEVECCIRRMFNFELHRALFENEEFGKERRNLDVVYDFMRAYHLKSITEDALLKNYYRYRNRLRQKRSRKYRK